MEDIVEEIEIKEAYVKSVVVHRSRVVFNMRLFSKGANPCLFVLK